MHTLSITTFLKKLCYELFVQVFRFQLFCSILKKTINVAYQTSQVLDLYLVVEKIEMKPINVKYQVQVGY